MCVGLLDENRNQMTLRFPQESTLCRFTFFVCLALNAWFSSIGWRNNLLEGHEFRQTQTAITAEYFQKEGWKLDYPLPLFGPPWSAPLEFPLYQYCVARFSRATDLSLEPAGRLVSLGFFYLALPALFLLFRHLGIPSHRRWLFLAVILVAPAYLYYSRSFMIESSALCVTAWFLHAYCRAIESRSIRWVAAAAALGLAAALVKITTLAIFFVPGIWFAAMHLWRVRPALTRSWKPTLSLVAAGAGCTLPGIVAVYSWVAHGDAVKAANPLSRFLVSDQLREWTYGQASERVSPSFWSTIFATSTSSTLPAANLLFLVTFGFVIGKARRWRTAGLVLCFLAGPLVFANLYLIHDYYYYATGIFLLGAMTLAWSEFLDLPSVSAPGKWLVISICLAVQVLAFTHTYFLIQTPPRPEPPELAHVLSAVTAPDDVILIYGLEWNPTLPYYLGRRAVMVANQYFDDAKAQKAVLDRLPKGRIAAMIVVGEFRSRWEKLAPVVQSLELYDRPILFSNDTQCYLAQRLLPGALKVLENIPLHTLTLAAPADSSVPGVKRERFVVAKLADRSTFDMMSPLPVEVVAPFGIAASVVDGRRVFNAHAPTDVIFNVPAGARTIAVGYGVLPTAYEDGHSLEGVNFLVELIQPTGQRTRLFEVFLNPVTAHADRGIHRATVPLPSGATGRIVFSTLPGPASNISYNWAFWTDLTIK